MDRNESILNSAGSESEVSIDGAGESGRARRLLEARIDDLSLRADGGEIVFSHFLTPREQYDVRKHLIRRGRRETVRFYGGFSGAERRIACLLPDYMVDLLPEESEDGEISEPEKQYLGESIAEEIAMLEIRGSGYREITHRDVLGAVLGLGLERDVIGDILLVDGDGNGREQPRVYMAVSERISPFLLSSLKKIGSDTVRVRRGSLPEDFVFQPRVRELTDTVASNRLDCVIGALTNTSRDKAQAFIRSGLVEVDYEAAQRPDARLSPPNMISVRGHGKFRLLSIGETTRKGRLRLVAEQYL